VKIQILHPERRELLVPRILNDDSLVLRFTYGKTSFLLPGDIGIDAERQILASFSEIKSQVLKSPHHGSRSSSSEEFLEKTSPRIVVVSAGTGNTYGFPNQEVLERYKRMGAEVYRTDAHGAVEISSNGQTIFVRTASSEEEKK
jgi:competence protein ComEC